MPNINLEANITKIDKAQKIVEGYATTSSVDRDNERMDEEFLKNKFPAWADTYGNIRYMHQPKVVGHILSRSEWDGKGFYITTKISDNDTWKQIEDGELNGFSIGIKDATYAPDPEAVNGKLIDGEIIETSVVDIPSNRDSDFMVIKTAAVYDENRKEWRVATTTTSTDNSNEKLNESFEDRMNRLADALDNQMGAGMYYPGFIVQTYPDKVVVNNWSTNQYFEIPYEDVDGKIKFGTPVEVKKEFVPIEVQKMVVADVGKKKMSKENKKLHEEAESRASEYGISFKEGKGNLTYPENYPTKDSEYGDPVNYKYPIDESHIKAAVEYFNHPDEKEKGDYTDSEWEKIGNRIADAASKLEDGDYKFKDGKVEKEEKKDDDVKKDLDLSSGLQGKNLEGEGTDKTTVADIPKAPVETPQYNMMDNMKRLTEDFKDSKKLSEVDPEVLTQFFGALDAVRAEIEGLANQTDTDRDGDIDSPANIEDGTKSKTEPDFNPNDFASAALSEEDVRRIVKTVMSEVSDDQVVITKTLVADENKTFRADVSKKFDEMTQTVNDFINRLEIVEQMAAPPKGSVMAIEREIKKTPEVDTLEVVRKYASTLPEEAQKELFTSMYKNNLKLGGNK